jgi:hypothetical protein
MRSTAVPATPASAWCLDALHVNDDDVWSLIVVEAVRPNTAVQLRTIASMAKTEALLRDVKPDVALLDMHLGNGMEAYGR